jgi:hypothetical protein
MSASNLKAMQSTPSVFARVKPLGIPHCRNCLQIHGNSISVTSHNLSFDFTGVLNECSQQEVFTSVVPIVDTSLSGIHATVITCEPSAFTWEQGK